MRRREIGDVAGALGVRSCITVEIGLHNDGVGRRLRRIVYSTM